MNPNDNNDNDDNIPNFLAYFIPFVIDPIFTSKTGLITDTLGFSEGNQ